MNILEYALDVNKTKEEILELCKRLDISASMMMTYYLMMI